MPCPSLTGGGPGEIVRDTISAQRAWASNALSSLDSQISDYLALLGDLDGLGLETSITWDQPDGIGGGYAAPGEPGGFSDVYVKPSSPTDVSVPTPVLPTFEDIPDTPTKPTTDFGGEPERWSGTIPEVPVPADVTLPDSPTYTLPDVPALQNIPIPSLPDIVLPEFTASAPDTNVAVPVLKEYPEEDGYSSTELTAIQAQILSVLNGERGFLDTIWDQIWGRELRNEYDAANQAQEAVAGLWGDRGWEAPPGMEIEALYKVEQELLRQGSARARELAIEQNKEEVKRFEFHVSAGIELEGRLIGYASEQAARAIQVVDLFNRSAISLLEAKIARVNLALQSYQTQAQVFRDLLAAELAKLEITKTEIESAQLLTEIDKSRVELYLGQLSGIQKLIDIYIGRLEGTKTQVAVEQQKIDAAVARIQGVQAELEAKNLEYQGWRTKIDGQLGILSGWKTEGDMFAVEADAITKKNGFKTELFDAEIRRGQLSLQKLDSNIKKFGAEIDAESARYGGAVEAYRAGISLYQAKIQGETGRVNADARQYEALASRAQAEADVRLKQGEININTILRILQLQADGMEKVMTAHAQIGAAALAALDAQASISGNDSSSWNYSFQCE